MLITLYGDKLETLAAASEMLEKAFAVEIGERANGSWHVICKLSDVRKGCRIC